jgi:hypothetical protein
MSRQMNPNSYAENSRWSQALLAGSGAVLPCGWRNAGPPSPSISIRMRRLPQTRLRESKREEEKPSPSRRTLLIPKN